MLSTPGDLSTGGKGYVKCDISISAKGETIQPGPKASDAEEQISKYDMIISYTIFRYSSDLWFIFGCQSLVVIKILANL